VDEYLYSGNWCFIEWAENIPNLIPDSIPLFLKELPGGKFIRIKLNIIYMNTEHTVVIIPFSSTERANKNVEYRMAQ
jgi:hypothetical protein